MPPHEGNQNVVVVVYVLSIAGFPREFNILNNIFKIGFVTKIAGCNRQGLQEVGIFFLALRVLGGFRT